MSVIPSNVSFYRAYRNYLEEIEDTPSYQAMISSFGDGQEGDAFSGSIVYRKIDLTWVEAIEKALPYIDKAIREQRRFIRQTEEIVSIERSRKVTTESVRHLAQHTSMIGKVEENKVTPKQLLNIQREESFDIYENRFLRTLIIRAAEFVGTCYTTVKNNPGSAAANLKLSRNVFVNRQQMNIGLDCMLEYTEEDRKVSVSDDVSGLSEFERILRLRIILSDFLNTPLMSELSQTPTVRNPITRTNLITKDQNFREVLKLWEFLDQYRKSGFELVTDEMPSGNISPSMRKGIYDAFTMLQFVIKLNISENLKETFEKEYLEENERRRKEAEAAEEQRRKEALNAQMSLYEQKLKAQKEDYENELLTQNEKHENELLAQKEIYESELLTQKKKYEDEIMEQQEKYEAVIAGQTVLHAQELAEMKEKYDTLLAEQKEALELQLTEQKEESARLLAAEKVQHESRMAEQHEEYEKDIAEVLAGFDVRINELKNGCDEQISTLTETCEARIRETVFGCEKRICDLTAGYEHRIAELIAGYENRISVLTAGYEEKLCGYKTANGAVLKDSENSSTAEHVSLWGNLARVLSKEITLVPDMKKHRQHRQNGEAAD